MRRSSKMVEKLGSLPMCHPALLMSTLLALSSAKAEAGEPKPPTPWLKKQVDRAAELANKKVKPDTPEEEKWQAEAKAIIDEILDWDELTKRSLGRHWKKRSKEEQAEFSSLLRELIEASYKSKLKLAARNSVKKPKKIEIEWIEEKVKKNKATVSARVQGDKKNAVLEFSLLWNGSRWRVYDVAIDDASTVRTYRSSFGKLIGERGFPALLERMRSKIEDIRAGKSDLAP